MTATFFLPDPAAGANPRPDKSVANVNRIGALSEVDS
jgi:hypothetical protein